jgi:hypothetical protein
MSEPTPAPQPTPTPTPAPEPQGVTRPEWLPEDHWDSQANTIKPEFGQHFNELSTFHKTETERQAALKARKPEDIKFEIKLPETVKVPDGMDLKIDEKDPRVPVIREMAIKRGWDQDTVNELIAFDAQQQIEMHNAEKARIAAEDQKLGANAKARKDAVGNWLKGMRDRNELTADEYGAVQVYAIDAAAVSALEKIMGKAAGSVPNRQEPPPQRPAEKTIAQRLYPSLPSARTA